MKLFKSASKLLGIVLIIALVMSMGISSAFAAGEGSLTVKNSEVGTTYNFYRILDLTGQDTAEDEETELYNAVVYKLNTKWKAFWTTGAGASYLVAENSGNLATINVDGTIKYINITDSNKVAFTNAAMKYAIDNSIETDSTANGAAEDVSVTGLDLGYYLMIPVDATDEKVNPLTTGSIASLTSTIPSGDIYVKATKPSIDKVDDVISADIGQTVTYTVTGKMPNTSGTASYVYKLTDTMTEGLTFNKDVVVTIAGVADPITSQCTIDYTTDTQGFTCTIPVANLQGENGANIGKTITLTYTAVVNDNAVERDEDHNTVKLTYGRDPNHLEESTPISEEVYTAKIEIYKYTGDLSDAQYAAESAYADATAAAAAGYSKYSGGDASADKYWVKPAATGTPLANAQFALMNSEGKYYKYTAATETTPAKVEWVEVSGAPTSGTANVTDAQAAALAAATTITTKTTTADGAAAFPGIKDGTYYLVEFAAPAGYNRLETPQAVVVTGTDADALNENKVENKADATGEFDKANNAKANVLNQTGTVLPSTGGIGTTLFYAIGGVMVLAAVVMLIAKKRVG